MPPIQLDVWSDFACPWCFVASLTLEQLQREYPLDLQWHSYELRPAGSPPIPASYMAHIQQSRVVLAERLKREFNVDMNQGAFGISSRPALILDKYAQAVGKGKAYRDAVELAYWTQGQDISQPDILNGLLTSIGIEKRVDDILAQPQYEAEVDADIAQAQQIGITGVPALIFARRYLVSGAQPLELLREVVQKIEGMGAGV
jgi:predicted DsbA family dithiol-disulfide isomerase